MLFRSIGPQGSGKGTQAKLLSEKYKIPHISTGDIFRQLAAEGDKLGIEAREKYLGKGLLVPDEITIELVRKRLAKKDCAKGYILDGFPRTVQQAEALQKISTIDCAIEISLTDDEAVYRLSGRRNCPQCQANYNISTEPKPKKDELCDKCGIRLVQRADDREEEIRVRLAKYHKETKPVLSYYEKLWIVRKVDGTKTIEEVSRDIIRILEGN